MKARTRVLSISCVLVLACVATVAHAQQRRGSFRVASTFTVATVPAVAAQLRLTDDQTALAKKLDAEDLQQRQEILQGLGDLSQEERRERYGQYNEQRREKEKQLAESLGPEKGKRIRQLSLQAGGLRSAVFNRETARQLGISDDERRKALESVRGMREEFSSASDDPQAWARLLKKADEKLTAFLTDGQKDKWQEMLGKPAGEDLLAKIRSAALTRN